MQVITFFFLLSFVVAAQTNARPASTADPKSDEARLEGLVITTAGEPIPRANVRLQRSGPPLSNLTPTSYSQSSDSEGKFVFQNIAPGYYNLIADKAGFLPQRYGAHDSTAPGILLNISEGQRLSKLDIRMTSQGVITGRITDQDGDPLPSAQIVVLSSTYVRGRKQLLPQQNPVTGDDQGGYRIANLPPGRYFVSASDRLATLKPSVDNRFGAQTSHESNVDTFYPNVVDPFNAVPLEVTAGVELRGIDVRIRRVTVYSVRGRVISSSGPVPQGVTLGLVKKDAGVPTNNRMQLGPDGTFEYRNLLPGAYVIQTMGGLGVNGNAASTLIGRLEVIIADSNIEDLMMQLVPGVVINGTVRVDGGELSTLRRPREGQTFPNPAAAIAAGSRIAVTLYETEGTGLGSNRVWPVEDNGTFKIQGASASTQLWSVAGLPEGAYVKSLRFNGQDITRKPIDLTSGVGGPLEVVLSTKAADLSGFVANNKGESTPGVMVTIWPKTTDVSSPTGGEKGTTTDQNGRFRLSDLAPGDYYVAAWETIEPGLASYPEFLARFNGDASTITLAESGHFSLNLRPISSERYLSEVAQLP